MKKFCYLIFLFLLPYSLFAEDGSRLWLRFSNVANTQAIFSGVAAAENTTALSELQHAWVQLTGKKLAVQTKIVENSLMLIRQHSDLLPVKDFDNQLRELGDEGYLLQSYVYKNKKLTLVIANTDAGLLYGTFHLLRLMQTNSFSDQLHVVEKPSYALRMLNHWDNPDGSVERGYAGRSIWNWTELPQSISPRYLEYARANASIGINATVLNNVNASPVMLSSDFLLKVKAIADVLRPYHIRVFLAVNFASPKEIGGIPTADPMNKFVVRWWKDKVQEIYLLIPDFGGFLVKANSEGLPGPMDYGRTHVDGANMLADALKPHGGIVMWRAFVYEPGDDRVKLAYKEFHRFDGLFRDNVIIQVKNGPVDFQPREPFSPLFGAMSKTDLMPEFQITQEYMGQGNHLVYLATMWREFFDSDTYARGKGSTIAKLTTGHVYSQKHTAIAGVANIGNDKNWCGHHFAQANWYAFGRLAWNNALDPKQIAKEWVQMTFGGNITDKTSKLLPDLHDLPHDSCLTAFVDMMMQSHEACVNYMMPLGLHHIFAWEHHYGPQPWCEIPNARPDWLPKYYHRADSIGLGVDRTASGSNAVSQYFSPLCDRFSSLDSCPEKYLLWFHHVPWNHSMKNGKTLWEELCYRYDLGVLQVRNFQKIWDRAYCCVDAQRFGEVQSKLRIQAHDAVWWKDACLLYFQTFSHQPIPFNIERPVYELDSLKSIRLNLKHHN